MYYTYYSYYTFTGTHVICTSENILVATGSKPLRPKEIPFDDRRAIILII